jgi:hypothetical protein
MGIVDDCGMRASPTRPMLPEPPWIAELSMRTKSQACPMYGIPVADHVFRMNEGLCPMRACSDHADGDLTFISTTAMDLHNDAFPSHSSSTCGNTKPKILSRRCRKPTSKRSGGSSSGARGRRTRKVKD